MSKRDIMHKEEVIRMLSRRTQELAKEQQRNRKLELENKRQRLAMTSCAVFALMVVGVAWMS